MVMLPGRRARVQPSQTVGFTRRYCRPLMPLLLCVALIGAPAPSSEAGATAEKNEGHALTPALSQRERGPIPHPSFTLSAVDLAGGSVTGVEAAPDGMFLQLGSTPLVREDS